MLNYALNLDLVILPLTTTWPAPLSLAVAFSEVVLIEGAGPAVSSPLLEVAATLAPPVAGHVRHWGRDAALGRREKLFQALVRRRFDLGQRRIGFALCLRLALFLKGK